MIPLLVTWSRAIRIPLGKLMIPLSYVSELGGVCTLIGTSTNLVIKGAPPRARLRAAVCARGLAAEWLTQRWRREVRPGGCGGPFAADAVNLLAVALWGADCAHGRRLHRALRPHAAAGLHLPS